MQCLFIFVFALIGLQVFGEQSAAFEPALPSFQGFWNSLILVFQVGRPAQGCSAGWYS